MEGTATAGHGVGISDASVIDTSVPAAAMKLRKTRAKLFSTIDPAERARLQKRMKKLERIAAERKPVKTVPAAAFKIRHKWVL